MGRIFFIAGSLLNTELSKNNPVFPLNDATRILKEHAGSELSPVIDTKNGVSPAVKGSSHQRLCSDNKKGPVAGALRFNL